jgi:hypothetical protein
MREKERYKEKGPLTLRERPKSREETPKEGDGNARKTSRYRTATTYTAPHKIQGLLIDRQVFSPSRRWKSLPRFSAHEQ